MNIPKPKLFRPSPAEKWLQALLDKLAPVHSETYENRMVYRLDGNAVMRIDFDFRHNTGDLLIANSKIWLVLKNEFNLRERQIEDLTKDIIGRQYNVRIIRSMST